MSGYWENMYGNQPDGRLWHQRYSSSEACRAAQAGTGSAVRFDQCAFVDTTPPDITIIQDPLFNVSQGISQGIKKTPKEFILLAVAVFVLIWFLRE